MEVSGQLYPRVRARGVHWIGDWVGPGTGLDALAKTKKKNLTIASAGN